MKTIRVCSSCLLRYNLQTFFNLANPRASSSRLAMSSLGLALCIAATLFCCPTHDALGQDVSAVAAADDVVHELNDRITASVRRAKAACVAISTRRRGRAGFSGVIVGDQGHVLTAAHCISADRTYYLHLEDGRTLRARSLGKSDHLDTGVLRIVDAADFPWVEKGKSSQLSRHQPCVSISHPGGLNTRRGAVVRYGRVLGFTSRGFVHNTCLMEPGDSGGGLFDLDGRVIGIHSSITRSLADNFDVPIGLFDEHWEALCEPQEYTPPYAASQLGVKLASDTASNQGVKVQEIVADSPADQAGLQADDIIVEVNGRAAEDSAAIARRLRRATRRRGRTVRLKVSRAEEELSLTIRPHRPARARLTDAGAEPYEVWADLAGAVAPLEQQLDDMTVRIVSQQRDKETSILGAVVGREGLIVSKASRVGQSPMVTDSADRELAAEVLGRDDANDLILLKVDASFQQGVDLKASHATTAGLLVSPRPADALGLVGVVGTSGFASPLRRQRGFLGVSLRLKDSEVFVADDPIGPAKKAKLQQGDIILSVNDVLITSVDKMVGTIRSCTPGDSLLITIKRESEEQSIEVALETRPPSSGGHIADRFAGGPSARRTGFAEVFCHDAHVKPADCGGPLFDLRGNFAGLTIARYSRTHCYALPPRVVREVVERLVEEAAAD